MPARLDIDESRIMELYEGGMTFAQIAASLSISKDTVRDRLRKRGIVLSIGRRSVERPDGELVRELYLAGNSITRIAQFAKTSYATVRDVVVGMDLTKRRGAYRTISVNDDAFAEFTPASCYWAGFIAADGNVFGNQLQVSLHSKDTDHLLKLKTFLELSSPVFEAQNGKNKCAILKVRSSRLVQDLSENFNIIPNKSLVLQSPSGQMPDVFIRDYIRGYFDGDGCLWVGDNRISLEICSGSRGLLEWMNNHVQNAMPLSKVCISHLRENLFRFQYCSRSQVVSIMNWLYKDCETNFLERKKAKFEQFLKNGIVSGGQF